MFENEKYRRMRKMEKEQKPKKKKRLSETDVIIGMLVGLPLCIGLLYGFAYLFYLICLL